MFRISLSNTKRTFKWESKTIEPQHSIAYNTDCEPVKIQISLRTCGVWSESSQVTLGETKDLKPDSKDSVWSACADATWVFAECTCSLIGNAVPRLTEIPTYHNTRVM